MNLSRVSKYSVVIRNRNEERYIGHCIQSVVDFLGDDVQIIIVDNESTDESNDESQQNSDSNDTQNDDTSLEEDDNVI